MKKMGKGTPLNIKFYHGETKDGRKKTVARCRVHMDNIPNTLIMRGYFDRKCVCWNEPLVDLCAETICKDNDVYDVEKGDRIARKKIVRQFLKYIESVLLERAHEIEDERNDLCDFIDFLEDTQDSISEYLKKF